MSLGNGYSIDMSDGWTFVHALQRALDDLGSALDQHGVGLQIPPPGNDAHSQHFSQVMTQRAVLAHNQWAQQQQQTLTVMVEKATALLKQYGVAETENTMQWGDPGASAQLVAHRGGARAV